MKKTKRIFAVTLIVLLHSVVGAFSVKAQSYSVTVNTPGTFGHMILQTVENWSDIVELTVSGQLNSSDMEYFSRMQNMTKLDVSNVNINSFTGCAGLPLLQTVILPQSVIKIEDYAFDYCISLTTINLSEIEEIGSYAFRYCRKLTGDIKLPKLKILGDYAFQFCESLTTIEMPAVIEIGIRAFCGTPLTSVTMENVTHIGYGAFEGCDALVSINIPNCLSLGNDDADSWEGCFAGCYSLISVTLSEDLKSIPGGAFRSSGLKSIQLPSKLETIGNEAFADAQLSTIDIPEGVKYIGYDAFKGCPLETIALPSTLQDIGNCAFDQNKTYNPETGNFEYGYHLKDVYCKSVVPIVTLAFNNDVAKGATLHVPAFSVSAYKLDDNWYNFNKIVAIDGNLSDVTINNTFTIIDYTGLAENANLALTSSVSQQTAGHLTISGDAPLSLDNYVQNQEFHSERTGYYDENGDYVYRYYYPYCTTLITNNEVRANNVSTKVLLPTNCWSFISMPYDVNVSSIVVPEGTMWVVRKYNGSNRASMSGETWENVTSGQMLNAGEGYIFHCINEDGDYVEFEFEFPAVNNSNKNNIFNHNDVVKTINEYPAEFSHNRGWNLIGNPYPSYLDSKCVDFTAPITVWNGDGYTAISLTDDEYALRPNEAFFVQCPINTNQITFFKEGRTHTSDFLLNEYTVTRSRSLSANERAILNFIISNDEYSDRTRLVLNEKAAYDYEIERDASKFMSNNENVPQIYIIDDGVHYAIDERPLGAGEYSFGVKIGKEGEYKISLNSDCSDFDILLIDKETNETTNLTEKSYQFESISQTTNNRFVVKIAKKNVLTSIDKISTETIGFSVNGNKLSVDKNSPVSIYSIDGKLIHNGVTDDSIELDSGIYLLSINNKTHKIIIK